MSTNPFITFIVENFQRLLSKSPLVFKIWRIIASLLVALTGLPDFIQMVVTKLNITVPPAFFTLESKALAYIGVGMWFMSFFPVQTPVISVNKSTGLTTKATNESELPFTTAHETAIADPKNASDAAKK